MCHSLFMRILICLFFSILSLSITANHTVVNNPIWQSIPDSILNNETQYNVVIKESIDFIHIKVSSTFEVQCKALLTANNDTVFCLLCTYSAPERESVIRYYDAEWNYLYSQELTLEQVIGKENSVQYQKLFIPSLISASFDKNTINIAVSDYMLSEEEKKAIENVKLQRVLKWDGKYFK